MSMEENIARIDLASAVESLEPRARQVIVLRYYKDYTQQQVHRFLEAAVKALPEEMPADIRENYEMLASFIGGRKY